MPEIKKVKRVLRVGRSLDSSLSSFVERPVPTEREVASFERVVKREAREQEIDSNLSEIYSDKNGERVDVKQLKAKRRTPFILRLFRRLLVLALLALAAYFAYSYWFGRTGDISSLSLKIAAPEKIMAGEEFSYQVVYHNPTKYSLSRVHLEMQYPDSFIFNASSIPPTSGNYGWDLADLAPGETGNLTITGYLIAPPDSANIVFGRLSYLPGTYTSQFKKEVSASTIIGGLGFNVDLSYSGTAFLGQDNEMTLIFSDVQNNYLGDFNITFALPAEANAAVAIASSTPAASSTAPAVGSSSPFMISKSGGTSWQVSGLSAAAGRQEVPLSYTIKQKSVNPEIRVRLEKKLADGQGYIFWEKYFTPELVTSDLNLTMILNGAKTDKAVAFGQTLNYSLTYANRGASAYQDVVIMAALSGDFLDWGSLQDSNKGTLQSQTIIWTKEQIPALAEIKPGAEGVIDFSLKLRPFKDSDLGQTMTVTAYGQYNINNKTTKNQDNKSNTIISQINSDLSLIEQIRYFNDDNLPVGSGPLPPQVGQKTGIKVYWTVKNNLHELTEARVVLPLPPYVNWENGHATNVGTLYFDAASHQVVWEIGRLPLSVYRADAEFNISVTPTDADRNKILILSPGSTVSAMDTETKDTITKKIGAKTTKLEDDDIAGLNNSGIVQ
ncbi:MAG: hypothetical protein WC456_01160 [Patescibacteria group bacterium]